MTATPRDLEATERSDSSVLRRFLRNRPAVIASIVLVLLAAVAIFGPWLAPHDPNDQDLTNRLSSPGDAGLLGADEYGRDVLSRLIVGARVSLAASVEAVGIGVFIGVPLGLFAGYRGGRVDDVLSRASDAIMSVPFLILALTLISVVGYGLAKAMFVVGIVFVPTFFRVARAATQDVRHETFIESSKTIGCTTRRTVWRHVFPNAVSPLVVQTAVMLGLGVSAEASLSFLGLGVNPPTASWGGMLRAALENVNRAPFLVYGPGIMITVTVLSLTLVGDGLRDALGTRRTVRVKRGAGATTIPLAAAPEVPAS